MASSVTNSVYNYYATSRMHEGKNAHSMPSTPEMSSAEIYGLIRKEFETLPCDFPKKMNPHVEASGRAAIAWTKEHHIPVSEKNRFAELMGRAYPNCACEMLTIFTCLVTWIFYYDDLVEHTLCHDLEKLKLFNQSILAIFRDEGAYSSQEEINGHVIIKAVSDIKKKLDLISTPLFMDRFIYDVAEHLEGIEWESIKKGIPELATFLKKRPLISFVYPMLDLCELAEDVQIPNELFHTDYHNNLRLLINNVVWRTNDIISLVKEADTPGNNSIYILMHEQKYSLAEAVNKTKECCIKECEEIKNLVAEMPQEFKPYEHYIETLQYWISANYEWSKLTYRYEIAKQPHWQKV